MIGDIQGDPGVDQIGMMSRVGMKYASDRRRR